MSDIYLSEKEQIQMIKDWWKKYGISIALGLMIALIGTFSWRAWQQHSLKMSQEASVLYERMLMSTDSSDPLQQQAFFQSGKSLIQDYTRTPYAALAGMLLADYAVQNNKLDQAELQLNWVREHAHTAIFQQIASLREARILLAEKKPEKAMKVVNTIPDADKIPAVLIVKGDILAAQENNPAAKTAYRQALNLLPANAEIAPFVQMKLDQLA